MPRYKWEARTSGGQTVRGELEAPSRESALQSLGSQGLTVTRVDQVAGIVKTGAAEPPPSPDGRRGRGAFRENLFLIGVLGVATAISIGVAFIDPVQFYDCGRQSNGSVDCTVHRRAWGLVPLGDVPVPSIVSVDVESGEHSETMAERSR